MTKEDRKLELLARISSIELEMSEDDGGGEYNSGYVECQKDLENAYDELELLESSPSPIDYQPQGTQSVELTQEQKDKLLEDWQAAKVAAAQWKEYEQNLRKYIVEHGGIFDKSKESGTENVELGNGYKLKARKSVSYKVENKKGEAIQMVQRLAALGEASAYRAKELFRFDAELRVSKYKELNEAEKALVDEIITTKSGMPSLELVEPKS